MTRKTHPATGNDAPANTAISPIEQIRRSPHPGSTKAVALRTDFSTAYSTDIPLLGQLIGWVHSRTSDRYLKEPQVLTIIGRSKAAMRKDVSLGLFPAQVRTGVKSTGWRESEVMGWVEATTILSRVANPGFDMKEFVVALMASRIPL